MKVNITPEYMTLNSKIAQSLSIREIPLFEFNLVNYYNNINGSSNVGFQLQQGFLFPIESRYRGMQAKKGI